MVTGAARGLGYEFCRAFVQAYDGNRFPQLLFLDHLKEVVPPLPSSTSSLLKLRWLLRSSPHMQLVSSPKIMTLSLKMMIHCSSM
jgi:hypothetical protein